MAVLKANHLATAKAVAKKAQTIMRQADADGSGTLTFDEFLVVAKKFPNLVSYVCVRLHGLYRNITASTTQSTAASRCCSNLVNTSVSSFFALTG